MGSGARGGAKEKYVGGGAREKFPHPSPMEIRYGLERRKLNLGNTYIHSYELEAIAK